MQAEIITIGDEILIGQITDTNSKWIAEELNKIGVAVFQMTSIQDDKQHILEAIAEGQSHADIIIVTGGLGPTKDDITKHTLAEYFDSELEMNVEVEEHIRQLFSKANYAFTEINRQQALLPVKCVPLQNNYGSASGMWFETNGKVVVSLPGVPNEMKGLMKEKVLPRIQEKYTLPFILHKTVLTHGMGESMVAEKIEDWENALPSYIKLAYLPSYGKVRLRLSAKGFDKETLERGLEKEILTLQALIGDIIIGLEGETSMEQLIGELLNKENATIATAESCTGGAIAKKITSIPGASAYFKGSIVAYDAAVKEELLGVNPEIINEFSVVSSEVATEMALGVQKSLNVDYAIATTGNAGPTSDDTDKTVGVVFIALATPKGVFTKEYYFGKPRQKVIERTTSMALELLKNELRG
ncbi:competence/damage-inducible protein A [Urechidicola vernalis]|uniref:CinA-like protein n=1 Tax=Urechidicola vernalis TaxID=3075600 RepID=A0ABU2Y2Q1_9FLAO|nr:competence/damage-inducible protein A [Urechidicola sp. P050]MDT0552483.1 competence/damage-inducible protein A [Urechidicola sp. P050]